MLMSYLELYFYMSKLCEMYVGENSNSSDEEEIVSGASGSLPPETHMCPRCHEQFQEVSEFLSHRQICDSKARRHHEPAHSDPEDMVVSGDEDEEESMVKQEEEVRRHRQDAANNNSVDEEEHGNPEQVFPFPVPPAGHVTLEALQNTKVAVAQFAATALANSDNSEAALQELAVLQSTLFTLQHQQVFQLQLINQLQQQLSLNRPKETTPPSPPVSEGVPPLPLSPPLIPTTSKTPPVVTPTSQSLPATTHPKPEISKTPTPAVVSVPSMSLSTQPPLCSISSSLASTIITNNDPPPSLDEPNTLEMLQRRAQEVLDNASQGLLASNLADELAFRKGKVSPYDSKSGRNEPFFKHRCRYCGKVFGSDSALQIHIRSHTGERPFKCNVCGSRFTTKGNLKVHFQRHTAKFPHIKMNPNPVPEHLDKYHPPLLQQLGQNRPGSPGIMPPHPPPPLQFPHFPPLYRPPPPPPSDLRPHGIPMEEPLRPIFLRREEQEEPQNLTKPRTPTPPPPPPRCKSEPLEEPAEPETPEIVPKEEPEPRTPTPTYDDCSMESKYSNEEMDQDQPENLSMRGNTTCNICFKTFACNSALEIHYRSHTKERPFKCGVCDRGFSTKGNMKQHMLTHKIRDMPHHPGFPPPPGSFKEDGRNSFKDERGSSFKDDSRSSHTLPERPENYNSCSSEPPSQVLERDREREREQRDQHLPLPPDMPLLKNEMSLMKRSPSETDLPMPKRPPNLPTTPPSSGIALLRECVRFAGGGVSPIMQQQQAAAAAQNQANNQIPTSQSSSQQQNTKHLCHVCNKNFSSSSALQIHMRTHTGDKPFRCNVCQKAFTTKGNLKVHMGTHMWSNGASRRGRRMSLDLPPIPMTPKDSEFLQRRPDLFYPYLPAPFLNGMQQKLNEISVIQNPANGLPSPGKYASLLGFGYPPVSDPLRSQPSSPSSDKPPSSVASSSPPRDGSSEPPPSRPPPSQSRDVLPRVWDLHYDRQSAPEEGTVSPPSNGTINVPNPSQLGVPPSARGEGLAA